MKQTCFTLVSSLFPDCLGSGTCFACNTSWHPHLSDLMRGPCVGTSDKYLVQGPFHLWIYGQSMTSRKPRASVAPASVPAHFHFSLSVFQRVSKGCSLLAWAPPGPYTHTHTSTAAQTKHWRVSLTRVFKYQARRKTLNLNVTGCTNWKD